MLDHEQTLFFPSIRLFNIGQYLWIDLERCELLNNSGCCRISELDCIVEHTLLFLILPFSFCISRNSDCRLILSNSFCVLYLCMSTVTQPSVLFIDRLSRFTKRYSTHCCGGLCNVPIGFPTIQCLLILLFHISTCSERAASWLISTQFIITYRKLTYFENFDPNFKQLLNSSFFIGWAGEGCYQIFCQYAFEATWHEPECFQTWQNDLFILFYFISWHPSHTEFEEVRGTRYTHNLSNSVYLWSGLKIIRTRPKFTFSKQHRVTNQ